MKKSRITVALASGYLVAVLLLVLNRQSFALNVYFNGSAGTDFLTAANWTPNTVPGSSLFDVYGIDDGLTSTLISGNPIVNGLRVGSVDKTHSAGNTHSGRLSISAGATLGVIGSNLLSVGRENQVYYPVAGDYNLNTVVDAADYVLWRDTLNSSVDLRADGDNSGIVDQGDYDFWRARFGNVVRGGQIDVVGGSTLNANGALIGERTRAVLAVDGTSTVNIRIWDTTVTPNQFGGTEDLRVGGYGPAYDDFGAEPGLNGDGLVDVKGMLNVKDVYLSEHGATGELRLSGTGKITLNGTLHMDFCGGCVSDPAILAKRSSKVSIVGSGGTFAIGADPDTLVNDPSPPPRDLLAATPTATFSFTADAGGVTPVVVTKNLAPEPSGTAYIDGSKLVVDLSAYTSSAPLTLISAPPMQLVGTFGSVSFIGNRVATVNYDVTNGKVFLSGFHTGVGSAVPEPASLVLATSALVFFFRRQRPDRSACFSSK